MILSGGSINSPQLLMLSGIGDSKHLKDKGIKVVNEIKGVGLNLQDHLETYIQQECNTADTLYSYVNKFKSFSSVVSVNWERSAC